MVVENPDWDLYPNVIRQAAAGVALRVPTEQELLESHRECERERAEAASEGQPQAAADESDLHPKIWKEYVDKHSADNPERPIGKDTPNEYDLHPQVYRDYVDERGHTEITPESKQAILKGLDVVVEQEDREDLPTDVHPLAWKNKENHP